ncbi:hypothetical protein CTE05_16520 [Cellulomonas terrae]|uniref:Uncharacterized protein n=1 Tax=Cellulomonas terrae TaxID=311234 RepID=A0A511JJM6_9CELL|nr:hypothetical protein CTE05_16520 [Cellulomonas terrae]
MRTVNSRGTRTCTRSARGVPRGGVGAPRVAGRVAAGRDEEGLGDDDGVGPTRGVVPERGDDGRLPALPRGTPPAGVGVPDRGAAARRPGALGDAGRRGADMASIVPRTAPTCPDVGCRGAPGGR